jgi:zinc transporter ZupT
MQHTLDELTNGKIILLLILAPLSFFGSALPWMLRSSAVVQTRHCLHRFQLSKQGLVDFMAFGSALSGGVVLGAAFNHLLPDAVHAFEDYFALNSKLGATRLATFPLAEFISVSVFFLMIAIDKLVVDRSDASDQHQHHRHHRHVQESEEEVVNTEHSSEEEHKIQQEFGHGHSHGGGEDKPGHHHVEKVIRHWNSKDPELMNQSLLQASSPKPSSEPAPIRESGTAYLFLIALSVHSFFDGLGIGAEDSPSGFYGLMVAVLSHKVLDGFALGIPMFYAQFSNWQTFFALAFCAAMTPCGIAVGWISTSAVELSIPALKLTTACVLSMSLGSFLFISMMELIPAALSSHKYIGMKLALCIFGWAIMGLIAIWV